MLNLKNGSKYSFKTIAPALLSHSFSNMVLEAEMNYRLVKRHYDIDTLAASLIAYLPEGVDEDYTKYKYFMFRGESGGEVILASEWIKADTIQESVDTYQDLRIHGATQRDISILKNVLGLAGYNTVSVLQS